MTIKLASLNTAMPNKISNSDTCDGEEGMWS